MKNKLTKKEQLERVLKDSQFGRYKGTPENQFKHNRLPIKATMGRDNGGANVMIEGKESTMFDNPNTLAKYLDKNEIYAKGGSIDEIIYTDLYQQLRSKDMFKSNFSTKPKMRKLFNPKNTDSFGNQRPYGISIGENRFILKYYYPIEEYRDDDFETAKKIITSFYNGKSKMAKGGKVGNAKHTLIVDNGRYGLQNWYLEKIDSTHFYMSNDKDFRGMAHHIGQHRGEPYYEEVKQWLKDTMAKGGVTKKFPIAVKRRIDEINNLLPKVEDASDIAGGYFGSTMYSYVQLTKPIEIKNNYVYIHTPKTSTYQSNNYPFEKRYNVNNKDEYDANGLKGLKQDLGIILKAFKQLLRDEGVTFAKGGRTALATNRDRKYYNSSESWEKPTDSKGRKRPTYKKRSLDKGGEVSKELIDDYVYYYGGSREDAEKTLKNRRGRLSAKENARLDELDRKERNVGLTLTDSEEIEYDKLVRKYRNWDKMAKGGNIKVGDKYYSYENPDKLYGITYISGEGDNKTYKISLRTKEGYSYSSKNLSKGSLSKTSRKSDALKVKKGKMTKSSFKDKWGSEMYLDKYQRGGDVMSLGIANADAVLKDGGQIEMKL